MPTAKKAEVDNLIAARKTEKKIIKLKAERAEFQDRLERIYLWNAETLAQHSGYLAKELRQLIMAEKEKGPGFQ